MDADAPEQERPGIPAAASAVLGVRDHSRESAGLRHVYPVVSRRAGGLSVGINLNTNNACNWACNYCQVPDLRRGGPPPIDLALLRRELQGFLTELVQGDFMQRRVPEGLRRWNDIAFSGNGEPTAADAFPEAVDLVLEEVRTLRPDPPIRLVVISNGSQVARPVVLDALRRLASERGELWFKLDRGLAAERRRINGVDLPDPLIIERLVAASQVIPTWVQTCLFAEAGMPPGAPEREAYLALLAAARAAGARLSGVLLYTLARPSLQPGAEQLSALDAAQLELWAAPLRNSGLEVRVSP